MHSNPGGLTHWATINSCHQTSLFPHVGHFKLGLSVNPTASLTQCLPAMQQSSSSNRILHLTLPSHFLSLLPPWSHSLCTLPPLQLSTASAASIARAEVLPCGRTDVPRGCLSPLSLAWHSALTRRDWSCRDGCPEMRGYPMPCQKVWHEMSDPGSHFPPSLISRGSQDLPFLWSQALVRCTRRFQAPLLHRWEGEAGFSREPLQNSCLSTCCGGGNEKGFSSYSCTR